MPHMKRRYRVVPEPTTQETLRFSGELAPRHLDQSARDLLALLGIGRLDHHPQQWLGARRAHQDASPTLELGVLVVDGAPKGLRVRDRLAIRDADVLQLLGKAREGLHRLQPAPGER